MRLSPRGYRSLGLTAFRAGTRSRRMPTMKSRLWRPDRNGEFARPSSDYRLRDRWEPGRIGHRRPIRQRVCARFVRPSCAPPPLFSAWRPSACVSSAFPMLVRRSKNRNLTIRRSASPRWCENMPSKPCSPLGRTTRIAITKRHTVGRGGCRRHRRTPALLSGLELAAAHRAGASAHDDRGRRCARVSPLSRAAGSL